MSTAVLFMLLASLAAGAALLEVAAVAPVRGRPRTKHPRGAEPATPARTRWTARAGHDLRIEQLLDAAGRVEVPDADALAVRRRLGVLVGATWGVAVGLLMLPAGPAIGAGFAGAGLGRALPGLLLARAGARRTGELRQGIPELLDLLSVALACGLPIGAALQALAEWGEGPLAAGAGHAAGELRHGAGVDQTLARLLRDYPVAELEAAVAILQRSRRHGTPAAAALQALAAGARQSRARRAMDHAAKAAPRVQLVAALLLVPAALCVLAAALVAGGLGGSA